MARSQPRVQGKKGAWGKKGSVEAGQDCVGQCLCLCLPVCVCARVCVLTRAGGRSCAGRARWGPRVVSDGFQAKLGREG